ncbi:MAG: PQQ-dependent sugar dehydrogenase [Nitratireductor sp.]|nr:PQQ-dependent sugar dehydrogenase [Nitratireductor sp.]
MRVPACILVRILSFALLAAAARTPALAFEVTGTAGRTIEVTPLAGFSEPWAMTFLPDGRMLVTEKAGRLLLVAADGGDRKPVANLPLVDYGGQGGLGDVVLHPDFARNRLVYFSYVEPGEAGTRGAVVARAVLGGSAGEPALETVEVIWRQQPKVEGRAHYSHRIAFSPDGDLFITSGDRQKQTPAQDMKQALGKIIRLRDDGSLPPDNPWQEDGDLARSFWSMGHRNLLGIAFDEDGRLWQHEMGPRHGDELNLVRKGGNYGWPLVSEGFYYSGAPIPNHDTAPQFDAPTAFWVPTIAPSGLVLYSGSLFPDWTADALIGGLASRALIHVEIEGPDATETERFSWGERIREVEQGIDGAVYVLEDGPVGRLLKITPK